MKKIIALAMAAAMVVSVAACTSKPAETQAPAATTAAATQAATTAAAQAAANPTTAAAAPEAKDGWSVERPDGLPADYPAKDITFIYPFSAGGTNEMVTRIAFAKIEEKEGWKHTMIVKNVEGAGGDVGWSQFFKAPNDGYTIGFGPTAQIITGLGLGRDYMPQNLCYVCNVMSDPGIIGVAGDSPYNTLQDLIDAAKAAPGTISMGCTSATGSEGLAIIQIQRAAGVEFNVIPFDGDTAVLTGVVGHHCDAFCLNVGDTTEWVADGSIKPLATGAYERSQFLPDVPTYQEAGVDVIQINSRSITMPGGTPEPIVQYLSNCMMAAFQDADVIEQCKSMNIPWDLQDHATCTKTFAGYYDSYKALWDADPWM